LQIVQALIFGLLSMKDLTWNKWLDNGEQVPVVQYPELSGQAV
jgi:hypothetical protein